jgi:hypothetical protein
MQQQQQNVMHAGQEELRKAVESFLRDEERMVMVILRHLWKEPQLGIDPLNQTMHISWRAKKQRPGATTALLSLAVRCSNLAEVERPDRIIYTTQTTLKLRETRKLLAEMNQTCQPSSVELRWRRGSEHEERTTEGLLVIHDDVTPKEAYQMLTTEAYEHFSKTIYLVRVEGVELREKFASKRRDVTFCEINRQPNYVLEPMIDAIAKRVADAFQLGGFKNAEMEPPTEETTLAYYYAAVVDRIQSLLASPITVS